MAEMDGGGAAAPMRGACGIPYGVVMVLAGASAVVAYAVLRVPEWRAALMAMASHRVDTPDTRLCSMLAPRSVALAGAGALVTCMLAYCFAGTRQILSVRLPWAMAVVTWASLTHALIAAAIVINTLYYFPRQYGRPLWSVTPDEVLTHVLPQAWPDAKALRRLAGAQARFAFRPPDQDPFFLPALTYPLEFYDIWPRDESDWLSDAEFVKAARKLRLTHLLRYEPHNRQHPLWLRALD
ncbi:MAG: hypothetical protein N2111_09630 [Candidatus Sumerlaeaceae bacterium]|nr:hypothetical protein [Candidatus Sumerlaeaceae bacterium]